MVFAVLDQLLSDPLRALVTLASFLLALTVGFTFHEFSHAFSATRLGDPTAKRQGRLSLHPLAHLDPLGTAMILLAGFGWAKPVPVNAASLRTGPRTGMALVSFAGPLANVLVAMIAAIPINAGLVGDEAYRGVFEADPGDIIGYFLGAVVWWNLLLASFNLIPLVPLDGFKVAVGVLPREASFKFAQLERYGPTPLLLLVMLGLVVPGANIFATVIHPIINALGHLVFW